MIPRALHRSQPVATTRTQRRPFRHRILGLGVATLLGAVSPALAVRPGDISTRFPIDDEDPSTSIPSAADRDKAPLEFAYYLQDMIARAEPAYSSGNWDDAVKYYEVLATAVPDRAVTFSRLCVAYSKLGKIDVAAANCGRAIASDGAKVFDHVRFIELTLRKSTFTPDDQADVEASLDHLRAHLTSHPELAAKPSSRPTTAAGDAVAEAPVAEAAPQAGAPTTEQRDAIKAKFAASVGQSMAQVGDQPVPEEPNAKDDIHLPTQLEFLSCKLASKIEDDGRLGQCLTALEALDVDARILLPFRWTQALAKRDEPRATSLMQEAATLGLPATTLEVMVTEQQKHFPRRINWKAWGLIAAAAALLVVALFPGFARRKAPAASGQTETAKS